MSAPILAPSWPAGRREIVHRIALPGHTACTAMLGAGGLGAA